MKRLIALTAAVLMISVSLCSCMNDMTNDIRDKASEAVSDIKNDMTEYSNDNDGLLDDNRESTTPTNPAEDTTDGVYTEEGNMDDMSEDGRVEDGDGNIGDLENRDGDPNTDVNAAEYAQEQVSTEDWADE